MAAVSNRQADILSPNSSSPYNSVTDNGTAPPFFLYVAFNAPHDPLQAPEDQIAKYKGRYNEGWDVLRAKRHAKQRASNLLPKKWALAPRPENHVASANPRLTAEGRAQGFSIE